MPELPEVEVTCLGVRPYLLGQRIQKIVVHQPKLRWSVPSEVHDIEGREIVSVTRRAKYILISAANGSLVVHLGMSGSLKILSEAVERGKHDHIEMILSNGKILRYNDPRRFGAWLWTDAASSHLLLQHLGPEPLLNEFTSEYLYSITQKRKTPIKSLLMQNKVVVGVGNIYANESLFLSHILPQRPANSLSLQQITLLVEKIKLVLRSAIEQGGTTLQDFSRVDGKPGYFAQQLYVYGRERQPCYLCGQEIIAVKLSQRNSFYCSQCQI